MSALWIVLALGFSVLCIVVGVAAILVARPRYYGPEPPPEPAHKAVSP